MKTYALVAVVCLMALPGFAQTEAFPPDGTAGTQGPPGSVSWPLVAPNGSGPAPSYNFLNDGNMGCYRGLAASWGYDSLVCQDGDWPANFQSAFLQLSTGPPEFFFLAATEITSNDGASVFGQSPSAGATPWSNITLSAYDLTTGSGAWADLNLTATTAGVGTAVIDVQSNTTQSVTTFASTGTTFTDPILQANGGFSAPPYSFTSNTRAGMYYSGGLLVKVMNPADLGQRNLSIGATDGTPISLTNVGISPTDRSNFALDPDEIRGRWASDGTLTDTSLFALNATGFKIYGTGTGGTQFLVDGAGGADFRVDTDEISAQTEAGSDYVSLWMDADDATYDSEFGVYVYNDGTTQGAGVNVKVLSGLVYASLDTDNNSIVVNEPDGVFFNTFSSKPTCAVGVRGSMWRTTGGAGAADTIEICMKNSSDTYAWYALVTVP